MPNYKCKFNKKWLKLFQWVREVDDDIHKAYCKVCKSEIKIHVGGVTSLTQHKNTAKHKTKVMKKAALKQNSTGMYTHKIHSYRILNSKKSPTNRSKKHLSMSFKKC